MDRKFETGGVMGPIAASETVSSKIMYNFDQEVKNAAPKTEPTIVGPHNLIAEAIATAFRLDEEAHQRAFMRSRWYPAID